MIIGRLHITSHFYYSRICSLSYHINIYRILNNWELGLNQPPSIPILDLCPRFTLTPELNMRSSILIGALAALSHTASGLVFRDKLNQVVNGQTLYVLHGIRGPTSVKFGVSTASNVDAQGWKFDTEGFPDDQAVITPLDDDSSLVCEEGSICSLDPSGSQTPFRLARPDSSKPVFTIQDVASELYVCRSSRNYLELSDSLSDKCDFTLEKI